MKVSVIIATIEREKDLNRTLRSIEENIVKPFEVLIIDQGNINPIKLKCFNLNIVLIKINKKSLAQARNIGLKLAKGDIFTFLDDDVILDENYFKEVLNSFKKYNGIKVVHGKITNFRTNKMLEFFRGIFFGPGSLMKDNYVRTNNFAVIFYKSYSKSEKYCMWASGSNMNVKKEVFNYERFDSQLIRYSLGEDIDFSFRVYKRFGFNSILFQPKARLLHNVSPIGRLSRYDVMLMSRVNRIYFSYKNCKDSEGIIYIFKQLWYIFGCFLNNIAKIFKGDYRSLYYFFKIEYQVLIHKKEIRNLNIEWMNMMLFNEKSFPKAKIINIINIIIIM